MSASRDARTGTWLILLSAGGFAALPILARLAYAAGLERDSMLAVRFLAAGGLLLLALLVAGRWQLAPRGFAICALLGAFGYAVQARFYFTAVAYCGAGLTALLLYLYPSFVTLLAWLVHGERPGAMRLFALGVAFAGCALASYGGEARVHPLGIAYALASGAGYAAYLVVSGRLLRDLKALPAAAVTCLGASVTFWALTLAGDRITLPDTASRVSILLALTLFSTILPIVTLFAAIPRLGVARAALMSSVEPVITLALSALVLGERFSAPQVAGAVLIVGSVGLSYREGA